MWIPRYRRKVLKDGLKQFIAGRFFEITEYDADVKIDTFNIQEDHLHLVVVIPPK